MFISNEFMITLLPDSSHSTLNEINQEIANIIEDYCNTTFSSHLRENEKYDSKHEILPKNRPLLEVVDIFDDGKALIEDADYFVYEDKIVLENPSRKRKKVTVTYRSGFEVLPPLVVLVAKELLRYRIFREEEGGFLFYKSQRIEERAYETREEEELSILSRLGRYVQPEPKKIGSLSSLKIGVM